MSVIKLVSIFLICFVSFDMVTSLICYNCGYYEHSDGRKTPIEDWGHHVPYCDDFTTNNNNTEVALYVSSLGIIHHN